MSKPEDHCEKHKCPMLPAFGDWLYCPKCDAEERAALAATTHPSQGSTA